MPEYHLTPSVKDEDGEIQWPAPKAQITRARDIIRERYVHLQVCGIADSCCVVGDRRGRLDTSHATLANALPKVLQ